MIPRMSYSSTCIGCCKDTAPDKPCIVQTCYTLQAGHAVACTKCRALLSTLRMGKIEVLVHTPAAWRAGQGKE